MSKNRARDRAARARAKARGIPYTAALEELQWIQQLLDDGSCEDWDEADAYVCDPANQPLCRICGWSVGMICPECPKGCGCQIGCSGWRHREWAHDDDSAAEDPYAECEECGGQVNVLTGYGCACSAA